MAGVQLRSADGSHGKLSLGPVAPKNLVKGLRLKAGSFPSGDDLVHHLQGNANGQHAYFAE